ncbi:hypothetical protein NM688_g1668 [Phlebia brevispora]|uniref:Uncharacterized protein n=1 Tax=Phlebia brevispora TaxID=194682 RepID=A0ACC1TAZ0_9APHY|nr:hypothetical protein NM688_g1668 [Phlebia brevispora]
MTRPKRGASSCTLQGPSAQAADKLLELQTTQWKAAEMHVRHCEEEEKSQQEDAERILAVGPWLSKMQAGNKIRGTVDRSTCYYPDHGRDSIGADAMSNVSKNIKHILEVTTHANHPRSLLNHDHNDDKSDDSPLASSVRKPLSPKSVMKNASRPRKQASKTSTGKDAGKPHVQDCSDDDLELQSWLSDEESHMCRGSSDKDDEEDGDSYRPSEESDDTGRIDKNLEVPRHRSSTGSRFSMLTTSFAAPPPTTTTSTLSDEKGYQHHRSPTADRNEDDNHSDASSVLSSKIGNLPLGPVAGITLPAKTVPTDGHPGHSHGNAEERSRNVKRNSWHQHGIDSESGRDKGKSCRQVTAEAECPHFKDSRKDNYSDNRTNISLYDDQHHEGSYCNQRWHHDDSYLNKSERALHHPSYEDGYRNGEQYRRSEDSYSQRYCSEDNSHNKQHHDNTDRDDRQHCEDADCDDRWHREDAQADRDDRRHHADTDCDNRPRREDTRHDDDYHSDGLRHDDSYWQGDMRTCHSDDRQQHTWAASESSFINCAPSINIKDQQPAIWRVLDKLIQVYIEKMVTEKALYKPDECTAAQLVLIIKTVGSLGFADIAAHLEEDQRFRVQMNAVAESHLGSIRGNLKKTANRFVQSEYNLVARKAGLRVASLLTLCQWIYPSDAGKIPDFKKPFKHDIFAQLLAAYFFNGSDSISSSVAMKFKSSLRDKPDELEIPEAMLGLVCATVALSISDWASGAYLGLQEYDTTLAEEFYSDVMVEFNVMKESSMAKYHRVMHGVYKRVCDLHRGKMSIRVGSRGPSKMEIEKE